MSPRAWLWGLLLALPAWVAIVFAWTVLAGLFL